MTTHRWLMLILGLSMPAQAHEEPARTLWERAQQQRARERTAKARHKTCVNWTYSVSAERSATRARKRRRWSSAVTNARATVGSNSADAVCDFARADCPDGVWTFCAPENGPDAVWTISR